MFRSQITVWTILILWTTCVSSSEYHWDLGENFNPAKDVEKYCKYYGYPFEVYTVQTSDGYILETHRMPSSKRNDLKAAEAVVLYHGLFSSSLDFITSGPNVSIAMLLHDKGYDVWLGNSRGNTFGRNHTTLSPSDHAFWNFSWHEIGYYDMAATIDFVRNFTGHEKIFFIGYSQGTTAYFVLASLRPEYNERVKLMVALAPVAYMGHVRGLSRLFNRAGIHAIEQYERTGYYEMFRSSAAARKFMELGPGKAKKASMFFRVFVNLLGGYSQELNYRKLSESLVYSPAGVSCKQLIHYALCIQNPGHFPLFDYKREKNMRLYNSPVPPDYPVQNITSPILIFNSLDDFMAPVEDVDLLHSRLPNVVEKYTVTTTRIGHFDFGFGPSIRRLVYEHMLKRMKEFWDL